MILGGIMNKAALVGFIAILPFMAGCVHATKSVSDWHDNLITKDDAGLCVASLDDTGRDAENRKSAALEIINERKIKCNSIKKAVQKRLAFEQDYKKVECQKAHDDVNKKVAVGAVAVAAIAILAAAARSSHASNDYTYQDYNYTDYSQSSAVTTNSDQGDMNSCNDPAK